MNEGRSCQCLRRANRLFAKKFAAKRRELEGRNMADLVPIVPWVYEGRRVPLRLEGTFGLIRADKLEGAR
jgi:hypothetical protein